MHFGRRHLLINRRISGRRRKVDEGPEALVERAAGSLNAFGRSIVKRGVLYRGGDAPFDDGASPPNASGQKLVLSHVLLTGSYTLGSSTQFPAAKTSAVLTPAIGIPVTKDVAATRG